jgi:D-glycero-D-manno-heptose 1,7-bisphosphate phosphatase
MQRPGQEAIAGRRVERLSTTDFSGRPCLFLDRDGVLVEERHYLHKAEDVAFLEGVPEAISEANRARIAVVMITNQAGIGRGFYGWDAFESVQRIVLSHLSSFGAAIDLVLACANHEEGIAPYALHDSWRKPGPGMLLEASHVLGIDLRRSFIVGDKVSDLAAGKEAGLTSGALVLTGHGQREYSEQQDLLRRWNNEERFRVRVVASAGIAISDWLLTGTSSGRYDVK